MNLHCRFYKAIQSKTLCPATQPGECKGSESTMVQVVADLAVAEGREGEYKAGIYQFPIDYTKVLLSSPDSLLM